MQSENEPGRGEVHPLEHDYDAPSESRQRQKDLAATEVTSPPRSATAQAWIRWSLRVLIAGAIIAFFAGVASNNAPPQSGAEITFSAVNRGGILLMLLSCVTMLIGYRWDQIRTISLPSRSGSAHRSSSQWVNLLVFNALFLFVVFFIEFAVTIALHRSALILCAAVSMLQCSLGATMAVVQSGLWRCYGIGVVVVQILNFGSGMQMTIASMVLYSSVSYGATRGGLPDWMGMQEVYPTLGMQIFACFSGLVCAGYFRVFVGSNEVRKELSQANPEDGIAS